MTRMCEKSLKNNVFNYFLEKTGHVINYEKTYEKFLCGMVCRRVLEKIALQSSFQKQVSKRPSLLMIFAHEFDKRLA